MIAQNLTLLLSTTGIGAAMAMAGLCKNALEPRRRRRFCPSCGREIRGTWKEGAGEGRPFVLKKLP